MMQVTARSTPSSAREPPALRRRVARVVWPWGLVAVAGLWIVDSIAEALGQPGTAFTTVLLEPTAARLFVRLLLAAVALVAVGALRRLAADVNERRRTEADLREQQRTATLLAEVGLALGRSDPLQTLLQRCTDAIVLHLDAALARIWTLDADGAALTLQASAGLSTRLDGKRRRVEWDEGTKIAVIAREQRASFTNAVLGDPHVPDQEWVRREGLVSFAGYPIVSEGRLLGVLAMFARHPQSEAVLGALESLAQTLALGLVRHRAEAALRASEERFRRVFVEGPLGMALEGLDRRVLQANDALGRMVAQPAAALAGRRLSELAGSDDRARHEEEIERLRNGETSAFSLEERWARADGTPVWVRLSASTLHGLEGAPQLGLTMVEDVTEEKRAELALREAKERAEATERVMSEFLHIASHELRTPLNALALHVETLRLRLSRGRPVEPELAERLMHQVRRLSYLVGDLLDSARLDRGELVMRTSAVDLTRLVQATVDDFRGQAVDRELRLLVPDEPVVLDGDPTRIEQVLANLLDNALKYSPAGTPVEVELAACAGEVTLSVSDRGPGIPADQQGQLFTRFFRVPADATRQQPGLGLGLYICKVIAESHGGSLRVASTTAQGTRFELALPRVAVAAAS